MHEHKIKMLNVEDISHLSRVEVQFFITAIVCNVLVF